MSEVATALKKNAKLTDKTVRSMEVSAFWLMATAHKNAGARARAASNGEGERASAHPR